MKHVPPFRTLGILDCLLLVHDRLSNMAISSSFPDRDICLLRIPPELVSKLKAVIFRYPVITIVAMAFSSPPRLARCLYPPQAIGDLLPQLPIRELPIAKIAHAPNNLLDLLQ